MLTGVSWSEEEPGTSAIQLSPEDSAEAAADKIAAAQELKYHSKQELWQEGGHATRVGYRRIPHLRCCGDGPGMGLRTASEPHECGRQRPMRTH